MPSIAAAFPGTANHAICRRATMVATYLGANYQLADCQTHAVGSSRLYQDSGDKGHFPDAEWPFAFSVVGASQPECGECPHPNG